MVRAMNNHVIGSKIKTLRDRKAWTQEDLADAAKLSVRTVQRAEEGVLSAETLAGIAATFDVRVEQLSATSGPPIGWSRITPALFYDDAEAAIAWLVRAFGFEVRLKIPGPDGSVMHSELTVADGVVMVASAQPKRMRTSPRALGGVNQSLYVFVDDVQSHFERAKAAAATIVQPPAVSNGNRQYFVEDLEGHQWGFAEHVGCEK
jgi:uncharacterized glyoxalase superfamily protein PhnB/DNA-binding XRE family transcriptional regulator